MLRDDFSLVHVVFGFADNLVSLMSLARKDYNDAAKSYNSSVRRFPKNIIAGMFGFEKVEYFEAQAGSESVPQVSFD